MEHACAIRPPDARPQHTAIQTYPMIEAQRARKGSVVSKATLAAQRLARQKLSAQAETAAGEIPVRVTRKRSCSERAVPMCPMPALLPVQHEFYVQE